MISSLVARVTPSGALPRWRTARERGIALISVVSVLVLLAIVATPFLVTMRDSAARGDRFLYSARADWEAESLFELTRAHLTKSLQHVERRKLDEIGVPADGARPPDDATPTSDTYDEFQVPDDMLERFNRVSAREQRVWDVDVIDLQSRLNLNGCSYPILANILGRTELVEEVGSDDSRLPVADASVFPPEGGVVRVGNEVVKYGSVAGNELVDCERGYKSEQPENAGPGEWQPGDVVVLEAAFQIATRPFRARPGAYVRYTNPYQARSISDLDVAALSAEEFDRLRPYVTTWSGNIVGDGWSNPQLVRNAIVGGDSSQLYAEIKNPRYFGVGTIVRLTDGLNSDYAVVTKIRGTNQVLLAGRIEHDFQADQTRIYSLARAPLNLNTTDARTLVHVFNGVGMRGQGSGPLTLEKARALAEFLKTWTVEGEERPGVYRNWNDFVTALDAARSDAGILGDSDHEAILLNAMNANDSTLSFSTVPFTFESFDNYEVRATAALMDATGRELARREFRRILVASSTSSGTYVVETQADFQDQIMKSRDGKWFATYPDNINAYWDGENIPASEYFALAQKSRFPSGDRSPSVGHVALLPGAFRYADLSQTDDVERVFHFDESDLPEGLDLEENNFDVGVDGPFTQGEEPLVDLVEYGDVEGLGNDIELGLKDFAVSLWYQPTWSRGEGDQVVFDYGLEVDHTNRVSLRYDNDRDMLILAVADATREERSREVFYEFDHTTWEADTWYHLGVHVGGTHASQLELFIDGEKQGRASGITVLTSGVANTGDVTELRVEDASSFPDSGALILRGAEGAEIFEYGSRTENTFSITRRKARTIDHRDDADEPRTHDEGDVVELYGFTGPLLTDIKAGGGTTQGSFGPFRVYRFHYEEDEIRVSGAPLLQKGLAYPAAGMGGSSIPGITLSEWDTGSTDPSILDDIGNANTEGLAMIVSNSITLTVSVNGTEVPWMTQGTNASGEEQSNDIGGTEIVRYRVTNPSTGEIEILRRHVDLVRVDDNETSSDGKPRFIPTYSYGDTNGQTSNIAFDPASPQLFGAYTAFIPIAVVSGSSGGDYLDPAENEPQVDNIAYVQVDSEWIKYDTYDTVTLPGQEAFYRALRLVAVQALFPQTGRTLEQEALDIQGSEGAGRGGSGGTSPEGYTPGHAQDGNDEQNLPPEPQGGGASGYEPPPSEVLSFELAQRLDFRGLELPSQDLEFRIANTIPAEHASGTQIIPTFCVIGGNSLEQPNDDSRRGAFPGFDDLLTIRDTRFNDEHVRVQWGYQGWVGLTGPTTQQWQWDRPDRGEIDLQRYDSRVWSRVLKFPSGELPDAALTGGSDKILFGRPYDDDGGTSPAVIDEVFFPDFDRTESDRANYALLGEVPQALMTQQTQPTNPQGQPVDPRFEGIDDSTDEIPAHLQYYDANLQAIVLGGVALDEKLFPGDGGIIKIDEELITYSEIDLNRGVFSGCVRGMFGTEPADHQYNAVVSPIHVFPASRLVSDVDETSASFELFDATDFPDDGYLRIGNAAEIVGYTEREDNQLSGPLGRIDSEGADVDPTVSQALTGGGLFRGRFGTTPETYVADDIVIAFPFRVYDRYAERSDDPENSYVQLSWTKPGAVWKRVTWSEVPREFVEVAALVRFAGGPEWDSSDIIRVGQEGFPDRNRTKYLYEITDATAMNLINVESDRIEVRLVVRYAQGAYDRFAEVAPDSWKQSPWIEKVVIEYVAPPSVIYEDK